jgi:hypothetical protein
MRPSTALTLGPLVFAATTLSAQVSGPFLGYLPDGKNIRPVLGIPSSASVAGAIDSFPPLSRAVAAPNGDHVLAVLADTGEVAILRPGRGVKAVEGAGVAPDSMTLSPRGTSAVLWFNSISRAQIVTGLPDAPQLRGVEAAFLGENPSALAISDDGAWLAGLWSKGLYAFGPLGESNWVSIEDGRTLSFFEGNHDLAVATPRGVYRVIDIGGRSEVRLVVAAGESGIQPAALAVSAGNTRVILAEQSGKVTSVRIEDGAVKEADCGCVPQGLFRMTRSAFRLTDLTERYFKLFDSDTGEVLFAPLADAAAEEGGAQ